MSVPFQLSRDINGYNGFGLVPSGTNYSGDKVSVTLLESTPASITLPQNQPGWLVIFSYSPGTEVWVAYNGTAAVPAGNTIVATTSEMLPNARQLAGGDIISLITPNATANVGISWWYFKPTGI